MADKRPGPAPLVRYIRHKTGNNDVQYFYHKHLDYGELVFLEEGEGLVTVDGRQYEVKSGDMLVFNQGIIHGEQYQPAQGTGLRRWIMGLSGLSLPGREAGQLLPEGMQPVVHMGMPAAQLAAWFSLLEEEVEDRQPRQEQVCTGLLHAFFAWLDRYAAPQEQEAGRGDTTTVLASQIQAYIKIHFCENLTLQSLAGRFYISPYYLAHIMKECLGISTIKYITHLRVVEARDLLRSTKYPVKQIAQMVGYQNSRYFLNVFKKSTGMSPKEYRTSTKELLME